MNARFRVGLAAIGLIQALLAPRDARAQQLEPVPIPGELQKLEQGESGEWSLARDAALERFVRLSLTISSELGLKGPVKLDEVVILDPLREAVVLVEDLKKFGGQSAAALIKDQERLIFPVMQGERVVSSLTIAKLRSGRWVPAAFGSVSLIRALLHARISVAKLPLAAGRKKTLLHPGKKARYRSVTITGLNQRFLAAEGPGGTYLTPLVDSPAFNFKRGVPLLATEVFLKLVPSARLHNGLPT